MTIRVGDRVRVSPDIAGYFRQPFRDWIAAGREATVTCIIRGGKHYHTQAQIAFGDAPETWMVEEITYLKKTARPGEEG